MYDHNELFRNANFYGPDGVCKFCGFAGDFQPLCCGGPHSENNKFGVDFIKVATIVVQPMQDIIDAYKRERETTEGECTSLRKKIEEAACASKEYKEAERKLGILKKAHDEAGFDPETFDGKVSLLTRGLPEELKVLLWMPSDCQEIEIPLKGNLGKMTKKLKSKTAELVKLQNACLRAEKNLANSRERLTQKCLRICKSISGNNIEDLFAAMIAKLDEDQVTECIEDTKKILKGGE